VKVLFWLAVVGLVVGVVAAVVFAWFSPGSKTMAIATATLFGAAVLFGLQLGFELRAPEPERDSISVEYTIDHGAPFIRQWLFEPGSATDRLHYEDEVSNWLAKNQPDAFANGERLMADLAVAELLLFFVRKQFDWQSTTTRFRGRTAGTMEFTVRVSKSNECTELRPEDLERVLSNSGNGLARVHMRTIGGGICLPPNSTMALRERALTIANRFGALRFELVPSRTVSYVEPQSRRPVPPLPDGTARFETRVMDIAVVNTKSGWYSQHRDAAKYEVWRKNVVSGLHEWFER
jgi:hypothetical protein